MAVTDETQPAAPIMLAFEGSMKQRRLTVFFRLILIIPQVFVLFFIGIAAFFVVVIGWFGALFMGRLPRFAADFLPGVLRWQMRVSAYQYLMTDKYPPFTLEPDDTFPVWVAVEPGPLNRWAVLFRLVLGLPAAVLAYVVQGAASTLIGFIAWVIVLFSGRMPPSLYQAYAAVLRYQARFFGYSLMVTSEYPWGLFGDKRILGSQWPPPAYGSYGAPPAYGATPAYGAHWPPPADPTPPSVPTAPSLPGVTFTFGGPTHLWGYTDDRSQCGIWLRADPNAPPQMWPIGEQGEAWTKFWTLDPGAAALDEPLPPPPTATPWSGRQATPYGSSSSPYGAAPSYGTPYPASVSPEPGRASLPANGNSYPVAGSAVDDPRWRLILSSGAVVWLVVFLVLGALADIGNITLRVGSHSFLQGIEARVQVQVAYDKLNSAVGTYETDTKSCGTSLNCLTTAARVVAPAFGTFTGALRSISMPADAASDASRLGTVSTHAELFFSVLGSASSQGSYHQTVESNGPVLTQFADAYQALLDQLQ